MDFRGHGGRRKVGPMKSMRVWGCSDLAGCSWGSRRLLTRALDAGFFLRIADQSLLITRI